MRESFKALGPTGRSGGLKATEGKKSAKRRFLGPRGFRRGLKNGYLPLLF